MDRSCAFLTTKPHCTITVGIKKIVRKVLHFQWYSIQCFLFTNYTYPVKPYWWVSIIKFDYIIVILFIYSLFNWCDFWNFKITGITVAVTVTTTVAYKWKIFTFHFNIYEVLEVTHVYWLLYDDLQYRRNVNNSEKNKIITFWLLEILD